MTGRRWCCDMAWPVVPGYRCTGWDNPHFHGCSLEPRHHGHHVCRCGSMHENVKAQARKATADALRKAPRNTGV